MKLKTKDIVRQLLRAHEYWRMKQLAVDLVILNEQAASYAQDLQAALETQVRASQSRLQHEGHGSFGNVFILQRRSHFGRGSHTAPDCRPSCALEPPRYLGRASGTSATIPGSLGCR